MAWAFRQARLLFPHDRRQVIEWWLESRGGGLNLKAAWGLSDGALPVPPDLRVPSALLAYDPDEEPDPTMWQLVPPVWRPEVVAAGLRRKRDVFDENGPPVDRVVEIEDALAAGKPKRLVDAMERVEALGAPRGVGIRLIAAGLAARPGLSLSGRANRELDQLCDGVVEYAGSALQSGGARR